MRKRRKGEAGRDERMFKLGGSGTLDTARARRRRVDIWDGH